MHKPKQTLKSEECKILWDFPIQRGKQLEHNRPYITMTDKKKKHASLLTHHAPLTLVLKRKKQKLSWLEVWNQTHLEDEKGKTIPVIIDALETILKDFSRWMEKMELDLTVEML